MGRVNDVYDTYDPLWALSIPADADLLRKQLINEKGGSSLIGVYKKYIVHDITIIWIISGHDARELESMIGEFNYNNIIAWLKSVSTRIDIAQDWRDLGLQLVGPTDLNIRAKLFSQHVLRLKAAIIVVKNEGLM